MFTNVDVCSHVHCRRDYYVSQNTVRSIYNLKQREPIFVICWYIFTALTHSVAR